MLTPAARACHPAAGTEARSTVREQSGALHFPIVPSCLRAFVPSFLCLLLAVPGLAQTADDRALDALDVVQQLNEKVPLDAAFADAAGRDVRLGDYFDNERPVILVPVYYRCPMLCTQVLNALVRNLRSVDFKPGEAFEVVVFSIDPKETPTLAAQKKLQYLDAYGDVATQDGWHFLTGRQSEIRRVADAIGFHYAYDAERDLYAHAAAVLLVTPDGRIARYLLGLDYKPRDLRFALLEAGEGRIGSPVDQVLMRCFAYDPATGRYGFAIMTALRIGGVAVVLSLVGMMLVFRRRETKRRRDEETKWTSPLDRDEVTFP